MQSEFYRDLFESTRCGILTIDEAGRVTTLNRFAREILDLPDPAPDSLDCSEFLRDYPPLSRILTDSLRMENPPSRIEVELKGTGVRRRVIGGTISHIKNGDGTRGGAVLFFKDLTQIEEGEEQERLKERLAALGEMAAGLAHEIRNPLGNIGTTASLLKRKLSGNDSGILALDNIVREVRRLNQTVTQCLEYAKPVNVKAGPVRIPLLVAEALQEVRAKWPGHRVTVEQFHDERLSDLRADGIQLRQVLHNLLANAFDAMDGRGSLEITSHRESAEGGGRDAAAPDIAVIRVRDSGRGISAEVRERLFYPFFTTKPGGSGIGLAVAKKIVESHRGVIDVESEPGRGAAFTVRIPYPTRPDSRGGGTA